MMTTTQAAVWLIWAYHEHGPFLIAVPLQISFEMTPAGLGLDGFELVPTSQRVAMAYEASRKLGRFIDPTQLSSHAQLNAFTIARHGQWPWYKVCHYRGN